MVSLHHNYIENLTVYFAKTQSCTAEHDFKKKHSPTEIQSSLFIVKLLLYYNSPDYLFDLKDKCKPSFLVIGTSLNPDQSLDVVGSWEGIWTTPIETEVPFMLNITVQKARAFIGVCRWPSRNDTITKIRGVVDCMNSYP